MTGCVWLRVAEQDALHFSLLVEHLATPGHAYGDFPAHDGLWAMAERAAGDFTARTALVPRTLQACGRDATPPMYARLRQAGDLRAVAILASSCATKSGTSPSATAGTAGRANARASTPWRTTRCLPNA